MANDVKHVQLTPADFTGDADFVAWPAAERGVYWTLIIFMYQNGGYLPNDPKQLARLCNCDEQTFMCLYQTVRAKFNVRGTKLYHKRVLSELRRAREFRKAKRQAGLKGAETRWQSHSTANGKGWLREGKVREVKGTKKTPPPSPPLPAEDPPPATRNSREGDSGETMKPREETTAFVWTDADAKILTATWIEVVGSDCCDVEGAKPLVKQFSLGKVIGAIDPAFKRWKADRHRRRENLKLPPGQPFTWGWVKNQLQQPKRA